ncbi:elongation factor P hydroxylase, partial [Salmonella enterica subsp. enterica serovar Anatum]|nr:elongation factor P hydroxylase [Salmonella enterica subsp. enterica serovar Anatum]
QDGGGTVEHARLKEDFKKSAVYQAGKLYFNEVEEVERSSRNWYEISHWCIAGKARRELVDFGYWYCPDGRDAQTQSQFEDVEVKP